MKILIVVNNSWASMQECMITGIMPNPNRRAIEIELTEEQVKKIGLRRIGSQGDTPVYESIESISLIDEQNHK